MYTKPRNVLRVHLIKLALESLYIRCITPSVFTFDPRAVHTRPTEEKNCTMARKHTLKKQNSRKAKTDEKASLSRVILRFSLNHTRLSAAAQR